MRACEKSVRECSGGVRATTIQLDRLCCETAGPSKSKVNVRACERGVRATTTQRTPSWRLRDNTVSAPHHTSVSCKPFMACKGAAHHTKCLYQITKKKSNTNLKFLPQVQVISVGKQNKEALCTLSNKTKWWVTTPTLSFPLSARPFSMVFFHIVKRNDSKNMQGMGHWNLLFIAIVQMHHHNKALCIIMPNVDVKDTEKVWVTYVNKISEIGLEHAGTNQDTTITIYFHSLRCTSALIKEITFCPTVTGVKNNEKPLMQLPHSLFVSELHNCMKRKGFRFDCFASFDTASFTKKECRKVYKYSKDKNCKAVRIPAGHIHISGRSGLDFATQKWTFELNRTMQLNLNFIHLSLVSYLGQNNQEICSSFLLVNINDTDRDYQFCGTYSFLSWFSRSHNVTLEVRNRVVSGWCPIFLNLQFQVLSFGTTMSFNHNNFTDVYVRLSAHQNCAEGDIVHFYFFQTYSFRKVCFLLTNKNHTEIILFDGPVFTWKAELEFANSSSVACASTHQATATFTLTKNTHTVISRINFTSQQMSISNFSKGLMQKITVRGTAAVTVGLPNPGVFGTYPGVILSDLIYQGEPHYLCYYGGVKVYELSEEGPNQLMSLCSRHKNYSVGGLVVPIKIFSRQKHLLVSMFKYENLSNIIFKMKETSTTCQPINYNPCVCSKTTSSIHCQRYRFTVTENSIVNWTNPKQLQLTTDGCVLLHMSDEVRNFHTLGSFDWYPDLHHCQSIFLSPDSQWDQKMLWYQIYGFSEGKSQLPFMMRCCAKKISSNFSNGVRFFEGCFHKDTWRPIRYVINRNCRFFLSDGFGTYNLMLSTTLPQTVDVLKLYVKLIRQLGGWQQHIIKIASNYSTSSEQKMEFLDVKGMETSTVKTISRGRGGLMVISAEGTSVPLLLNMAFEELTLGKMHRNTIFRQAKNLSCTKQEMVVIPDRAKDIHFVGQTIFPLTRIKIIWMQYHLEDHKDTQINLIRDSPGANDYHACFWQAKTKVEGTFLLLRWFDLRCTQFKPCTKYKYCYSTPCHDGVFSWQSALQECKIERAHFPILYSQTDQNRLLSFLKLLKVPVEAMYIGLVKSKKSQVRFFWIAQHGFMSSSSVYPIERYLCLAVVLD